MHRFDDTDDLPPDPFPYGEAAFRADPAADSGALPTAEPADSGDATYPPKDNESTRPFTRAAGIAAGISAKTLRGPRFRRVFRDVYVAAEVPDRPRLRAEAALAIFAKGSRLSHSSAARLYDAIVPDDPFEHVTVAADRHRRRVEGVRCHLERPSPAGDASDASDTTSGSVAADATSAPGSRSEGGRVRTVDGLPASAPGQLFVEMAPQLTLVEMVVLGDSLVKRGHTTPAEFVDRSAASSAPGARRARRAASYVRAGVDSPMESRLRMLIVLAGLPEPVVNLTIRDVDGQPVRRYDLCWPQARVIVEYDGRLHAERVEQWESDLARREAIDDERWRIIVVTSSGIYREPDRTVDRIWRLLRDRGLAGVPARPSESWRRHFGR